MKSTGEEVFTMVLLDDGIDLEDERMSTELVNKVVKNNITIQKDHIHGVDASVGIGINGRAITYEGQTAGVWDIKFHDDK